MDGFILQDVGGSPLIHKNAGNLSSVLFSLSLDLVYMGRIAEATEAIEECKCISMHRLDHTTFPVLSSIPNPSQA